MPTSFFKRWKMRTIATYCQLRPTVQSNTPHSTFYPTCFPSLIFRIKRRFVSLYQRDCFFFFFFLNWTNLATLLLTTHCPVELNPRRVINWADKDTCYVSFCDDKREIFLMFNFFYKNIVDNFNVNASGIKKKEIFEFQSSILLYSWLRYCSEYLKNI